MFTSFATYLFIALIVLVAAFQLALAAGMRWGELAFGGKFPGKLPRHMRIASLLSILVLVLLALTVGARAEVLLPEWHQLARSGIWVVIAYCVVGVIVNAITPSRWERILWLPVTLLMLISSVVVAFG